MNDLSRRSLLRGALAGAAVLLAACAPAPAPTATPAPKAAEPPKPTEAAKPAEATKPPEASKPAEATKPAAAAPAGAGASKLVFVTQTGAAAEKRFNPLIDKFKERSKVEVESIAAGASAAELQQKVLTLIAGGQSPDVFFTHTYTNPGLAKRKVPRDLNDFIKSDRAFKLDDFLPASLKDFEYQAGQYALPFITTSTVVAYNQKLFDEAGVKPPPADWSWEDYTELAIKMNKPGEGANRVYGTAGFVQSGFSWYTLIRAWHEGADIVSSDRTKYALNEPAGVQAVQWIADLVQKHKVHATGVEITPIGANEAFATGRIAFMPTISDYSALVTVPFEWDLQHLPKKEKPVTRNASAGHSIYAGTKAADASWEFMKMIYSKEGSEHLANNGVLLPTHKEIAAKVVAVGAGAGKSPKSAKIGLDAMAYSRPEPVVGDWIAVHRELTSAMQGVLGPGARPVKEALDSIAAKVNEAIATEPKA